VVEHKHWTYGRALCDLFADSGENDQPALKRSTMVGLFIDNGMGDRNAE
jgi:hypothetical protein